jgi:prepilin-type N-terminal cleavage/methylation domain-containing protein
MQHRVAAIRSPDRRLRMPRAFTLLELILVLAIVATLLTVTAASLRGFYASRKAEDAAGHFVALCMQARTRAITEATPYQVHINVPAESYWMTAGDQDERIAAEYGRTFTLEPGVEMSWHGATADDGEAVIHFLPDGRSQAAQVIFTAGGKRVAAVAPSSSEPFRVRTPVEQLVEPTDPPISY